MRHVARAMPRHGIAFGIEGDETQIRRITFPEPVLQ